MAVESSRTTTTVVHPSSPASIGLLLARVPLGLYFVFAAISKFRMENGVSGFVDKSMPLATRFMSDSLSRNYLTSLPYAELVLGLMLVAGLLTRFTAAVIAMLLVSFTIAIGMPAALGQLGEQVKLPFHPNIVYVGIALAIMLCGPGWISVDRLIFRPRRRVDIADELDDRPLGA
jgi:uncharacterized membrane protein YphA (DoxX/SURF4 family)